MKIAAALSFLFCLASARAVYRVEKSTTVSIVIDQSEHGLTLNPSVFDRAGCQKICDGGLNLCHDQNLLPSICDEQYARCIQRCDDKWGPGVTVQMPIVLETCQERCEDMMNQCLMGPDPRSCFPEFHRCTQKCHEAGKILPEKLEKSVNVPVVHTTMDHPPDPCEKRCFAIYRECRNNDPDLTFCWYQCVNCLQGCPNPSLTGLTE